MGSEPEKLLDRLREVVAKSEDRVASLQEIAGILTSIGRFRWVGFYDVDWAAGLVRNIA